ncbi:hypothetical protein OHU11_42055 (plasmid) [Streptomyces sp. NBC_00257]|uniref:hypothetical protein n=1 Tax=unclassified Streptomyces TaxID=2593676 RepID=UPI00225256C6|nr:MULTISPECIES: hypothetical protein [unclassified Streptomyces]MCX5434765.1 hypothetical protein [Streptomyces sp. NBC_00062]
MEFPEHSTYRVPTKRPLLLKELRSRLPSADDLIRNIHGYGDPTEYDAIADSLHRVFTTARNLAPTRHSTNCSIHPNGPVDPHSPQGWGKCLFCNSSRRAGNPRTQPEVPNSPVQYEVPPPPYTHDALLTRMRQINEIAYELHYRSPEEDFALMADLVHGAFIIARELSRPRSSSLCPRHPGAPIDPAAPGGPRCLFCTVAEIRGGAPPPPQIRDRPRRTSPRRQPPSPLS